MKSDHHFLLFILWLLCVLSLADNRSKCRYERPGWFHVISTSVPICANPTPLSPWSSRPHAWHRLATMITCRFSPSPVVATFAYPLHTPSCASSSTLVSSIMANKSVGNYSSYIRHFIRRFILNRVPIMSYLWWILLPATRKMSTGTIVSWIDRSYRYYHEAVVRRDCCWRAVLLRMLDLIAKCVPEQLRERVMLRCPSVTTAAAVSSQSYSSSIQCHGGVGQRCSLSPLYASSGNDFSFCGPSSLYIDCTDSLDADSIAVCYQHILVLFIYFSTTNTDIPANSLTLTVVWYYFLFYNCASLFCLQDRRDGVASHTASGIEFLDRYGTFIKERAQIEEEYAGKLRLVYYLFC